MKHFDFILTISILVGVIVLFVIAKSYDRPNVFLRDSSVKSNSNRVAKPVIKIIPKVAKVIKNRG